MKTKINVEEYNDRKVNSELISKEVYQSPVFKRHGKVTDITLGGSPSVIDLESDGCTGRQGTPKGGPLCP